ncbi:mitochondrial import inner membrane translocase subunit TIM10-like [Curcuma longa]|uniref:mitochondrial import inner membrane translocase subunit TIM10-like n=1 Tax=Curcuma longa TaxID=136217 RepID=UPI003D9E793C
MDDASSSANLRKEQNLGKLERELEFRIDLFSGLVKTCFNKCIDRRYKETELYIGENSCIDRCTAKYVQASNMIGQILASQRPSS